MVRFPRLLVLLPARSLGGCVAVAAGAAAGYGTAQYVRNPEVRSYSASLTATWSATVASMRDAGYPVAPDARPAGNVGRLALNDAVVDVWQVSESETNVRVKIGTFTTDAHRAMSDRIHDGIAARVGGR